MAISMVKKVESKMILLMLMYRDELKGRENCNPDINIEMAKGINQIHIGLKFNDANEKYLGLSGGRDNQTSFAKEWNNDYVLRFNWSRILSR